VPGHPDVRRRQPIVDPDTLAELGPGEVGEIVTRGPQVFLGYGNDPEATAAAFVEIGGLRFLRTANLARYDEDGYSSWSTA